MLTAERANLGPATLLTLIASRGTRALRPTEREKNANTRKVPRSTMASSPMDSRAKCDYRGGKTREGETQKKNTAGLSLLSPDANSTKQKKNGVASRRRSAFSTAQHLSFALFPPAFKPPRRSVSIARALRRHRRAGLRLARETRKPGE